LTFEQFKDAKEFAFVHPSTMFMVSFLESIKKHIAYEYADFDDLKQSLKALDLESKNMIFMPINDNQSIDNGGGSHW
jgi:hypothetical protein